MSNRIHGPLFALALAVVTLLALTGSLALAAPPATPSAAARQQTAGTGAVTETTTATETGATTSTADYTLHHPKAAALVTETVLLPGMMGAMGKMMSMMGDMQGMMGQDMMAGHGMMMGQGMMGSIPLTETMPMIGSTAISDCMMIGPTMSMMGSMMSMIGAMQTMQGMMAGHAMMGQGMMGSAAMTATMPMSGTMMGSADMDSMLDHMMQMMGQMQAMVTMCRQSTQATQPFDLGFIDSMIEHHQGAVAMAQQALEQAEHEEIRQMAQAIIEAQEAEIGQMRGWRSSWYADAAPTTGMGMDMGMMEITEGDEPFDLRFIDAMISHHEGAVAMAQEALTSAGHDEIRQLAQAIIDAQQAEILQLQEWRAAWYPDAQ